MSKVTLAPGLSVPADELATQVVAALGMRGSGKSNAMAVIAEGLLTAGVQVIILDYVGIWPSLRLDESGKRPSPHQIPVLGGPHGDTALVPHAGAVVAEALAQSGFLSEVGRAFAGDPGAPMSGLELLAYWKLKLSGKAKDMLEVVAAMGPQGSITRPALAEAVGMEAAGGSFGTYLSALRSNGLVEDGPDGLTAAEVFFR